MRGSVEGEHAQRPEIELAWRRASLSGLDPGMGVRERSVADVDNRSTLAVAAAPVLDKMVGELTDTRFSILLADRTSRIIDRRVGDRTMARALDRVLAVPGSQYLEETSGTNSLATAYELRTPIAVTGNEHYLEALKPFACYGSPIMHPITRRVEGVIDVSGPVADATALLGPFLMRATRDIELRLLEGSRIAEKMLLAEFQLHSDLRGRAVVALGENLVLTNNAAVDLVKGADHLSLRAIAAELTANARYEGSLVLTSGLSVSVRARSVPGSNGGALFDLDLQDARTPHRLEKRRVAQPTGPAGPVLAGTVLITGESGTGKTDAARTMTAEAGIEFDCAEANETGNEWIAAVRAALRQGKHPVTIDNIHLLDPKWVSTLSNEVVKSDGPIVMTCLPLAALTSDHTPLASLALTRRELQPLRSTPHRFASTVKSILTTLVPASTVDVAPSALMLLAQHDWPGNLRELKAVLEFAVSGRERHTITDRDLPGSIRTRTHRGRAFTPLETAERDAIVAALEESRGNKAAAAANLGIGRTTLYSRLRRYRIED